MSDFYARAESTAFRMIKKYGKPIVLTRKDTSDVWLKRMNPVTRMYEWVNRVDGTVITAPPPPVVFNRECYGVQDRYKIANMPGITVQAGDIRLYAVGIPEPFPGDLITLNGKTKTVVTANPVQPGEPVVLWDIQLR